MLVRASFLCGDYKAKAVQPTNAKHLEVEHGRGACSQYRLFLVDAIWRKPCNRRMRSIWRLGTDGMRSGLRAAFLKNVVRGDTSLLVRASFILFEIRLCETCFYFKNYVTF